MADEVVGLRIEVDSNAGEAVGSLRSQLKAAQAEVAAMSEKFGVTSKEAADAAKRAAELKDQIGDAKALTDAFNPDAKFKALSAALSGVAGGFAAVQGAMGLFGSENEELEKSLLKVQSAMALSQGLQSIGESIDSFKQLGAVIKDSTTFIKLNELANKAAAGAMKLFGVAVETTSTSFKVLKGAIAATGIGLLIVGIGELVSAFQNYTSEAEKAKEAQDKLNESIKEGADVGLQAELQYIDNEEKLAIARAKNRGASEKELFEIEQSYRKLRANSQIRYWNEIKDIDAEGALKAKAEIDKINTDAKVAQLNFDTEEKKRRNEAAEKRAKELQEQRLKESAHLEEIAAVQVKGNEEINAKLLGLAEKRKVDQINVQEDLNRDSEYLARKNYETALMFANLLGGLADAAGELAGKNTAEGKALSIATTLISTYLAAQKAYESQFSPIPDASSPIRGAIAAATAIVQGLARVKAIQSVQVPNNKGGGGSSPSAGGYSFSSGGTAPISPQTNVVTTQLTNQNLNELKNNTVRAYVVESDVTDNQNRIRRIQEAAEFGG